MTSTFFVFTELANTMKYGVEGSYITLFSPSDVTAFHRIVLIEVAIAILANCGQTDDGQPAMTKAHLTFDRMS